MVLTLARFNCETSPPGAIIAVLELSLARSDVSNISLHNRLDSDCKLCSKAEVLATRRIKVNERAENV